MTDEEIIEVVSALKANDKTMKDSGISDNLWGKAVKCITFLQFENAELKSSLTHANEECLKWHERTQNLLKDSSGSISGYEKKISDLQSENAALKERLEKAVELPVLLGTPILKIWKNRVPEDDTRMSFVDMWEITVVNFKLEHYPLWGKFYFPNTEEGKEAAEARLAELKGGAE